MGEEQMKPSRVGELAAVMLAVAIAIVAVACGGKEESASESRRRPSVFLITVDTLRADHLGSYGYSRDTSPNLDRFAEEALLFERCFSHSPSTRPSLSCLLSGFLPHETKVIEGWPLPQSVDTMAEILQRNGYQTAAVVSNYVLQGKRGWAQGFTIYDEQMDDRELNRNVPERVAEHTTQRAIELLEENRNDPLFLWVHYQDPHGPYTPPPEFAEAYRNPDQEPRVLKANRSLSGIGGIPSYQLLGGIRDYDHYVSQYDGEIRYFDAQFQRLLQAIQERGLYDDSLIVFTADHGEALGERAFYFSHIGYLYTNLTHVPLIVKLGDRFRGRRTDFCQHIDVLPTILHILDIEVDSRMRGRDILRDERASDGIYAETRSQIDRDGRKYSIVVDGLKLIHVPEREQYELFDLRTDLREEFDLADRVAYRERLQELLTRLEQVRSEDLLDLDRAAGPLPLSEEERRRLQSLGYVE